jgi:N-methylhydantoinase B
MATVKKEIGRTFDGVRLAILANRFEGIARKMANTLLRTGRSGVLNIARDFSCCIITAGHELLATADSLPIHVLSGPDLMARSMVEFHPTLKAGDAFLHNSPYHGCSHPADHTILVPVIDRQGRHRFTVLAKAHQADCGNSVPTTYVGTARDVYEEGALIFAATKIQEDYKDIEDVVRLCKMRIRVPEQWWGDYLAMIGAARIGEREVHALADELGWEALEDYTRQWFDYSEQRMIAALRKIPSGRAVKCSTHDPVPGTPPEGIRIKAEVTVNSEAATVDVDLRDNPDCLPCGLNLSEACARTSPMIGIFNSIDHTVPKNAGSFRRINIHLREGCVVGIPKHPTSCSVATTNVADRVANSVQCAIAEIADGFGLAECGAVLPPSAAVVSGVDLRSNQPFVNQVFLGFSGGAGAPHADAWLSICHVGNGGLCSHDSVELDELRQPFLVYSCYIVPDTEGAGRYRGAPSIYVEFGPHGSALVAAYVSDGTINAAQGARGGGAGGRADQKKRTRNGDLVPLDACAQVRLEDGERIISVSCGGGGYGDPTQRDPRSVRHDVIEGWVSATRAQEVYGVVLAESGQVDGEATAARRRAIGVARA